MYVKVKSMFEFVIKSLTISMLLLQIAKCIAVPLKEKS